MAKDAPPVEQFVANTLTALSDRDLKPAWLARQIGMPDSTLRFQLANADALKLRTALAVADALDVPIEELTGA